MTKKFNIKIFFIFSYIFFLLLGPDSCFCGEIKKKIEKPFDLAHHGDIIRPDPLIPFAFGIFANGVYNKYTGSFGTFENNLSCLNFENGEGISYSFGFLLECHFFTDISLQLRCMVDNKSGKMKKDYYLPIVNDKYARTTHELRMNLFYLSFDLLVKLDLSEKFYFFLGGSYGIPEIHKFEQNVKIASDEISYENGISEKSFGEKEITGMKNKISCKGGIGYNIPFIQDKLYLSPEISVEFPFTKIVSGSSWESRGFFGSIILKYEL
jgi:hypothetical protein